jgi:hypothetical protein
MVHNTPLLRTWFGGSGILSLMLCPALSGPLHGALTTTAEPGSFVTSVGYGTPCPLENNTGTDWASSYCFLQTFSSRFEANAQARAGYGDVGVFAYTALGAAEQVVPQIQLWSGAGAVFSDTLTFFSPGRTSGFIRYSFDIHGSSSISPGAIIQITRVFRLTHTTSAQTGWQPALVDGSYRLVSPLLPIFFGGSPIGISVNMYASAFLETRPPGGAGSALIDFLNTAQFAGLQVFDNTGAPISDFTMSSASGTVYPIDSPIPEPASVVLVLAGFGAMAWRAWRQTSLEEQLCTACLRNTNRPAGCTDCRRRLPKDPET